MGQWIERVYAEHRQGLYSLALAIVGLREDAEDAVHEAFARLCRVQSNGLADPWPMSTRPYGTRPWIACGAAGRCRGRPVLFRSLPGTADDPLRPLLDQERDRQVQTAVEALPAEKREVVVMKLYGQLTFAQIAAVLEEPLSTVATRYQRALDELRELLEEKSP